MNYPEAWISKEGNPMKPISPKLPIKIRNSSKYTSQPIDPSGSSIQSQWIRIETRKNESKVKPKFEGNKPLLG
jgi:hypothetical protein